jgi:hypothetical protein
MHWWPCPLRARGRADGRTLLVVRSGAQHCRRELEIDAASQGCTGEGGRKRGALLSVRPRGMESWTAPPPERVQDSSGQEENYMCCACALMSFGYIYIAAVCTKGNTKRRYRSRSKAAPPRLIARCHSDCTCRHLETRAVPTEDRLLVCCCVRRCSSLGRAVRVCVRAAWPRVWVASPSRDRDRLSLWSRPICSFGSGVGVG